MSQYESIKITYEFVPESGVKIGAGHGKYGIIDNSYRSRKTATNEVLYPIPGTSVKGRIRATLKKYSHILAIDSNAIIEGIFGKSGQAGWAHFSDLLPVQEKVSLGVQTSTSIDRFRKAAKHQSLRMEEYASLEKGNKYSGEIAGYRSIEKNNKELYALLFALLATTHFGADKTTGYGKGKIRITSVLKNGEPSTIDLIHDEIKDYLG